MKFPSSPEQWYRVTQSVLRLVVSSLLICSVLILASSGESLNVFGVRYDAHYYYSSSYKFFMAASVVVAASSLLSVFAVIYIATRSVMEIKHHFFLLLLDLVAMLLMIAGLSAATAIGLVGMYGEDRLNWSPICPLVKKFCSKVEFSLAFAYMAFLVLFVASVLSSYKLLKINQRCT